METEDIKISNHSIVNKTLYAFNKNKDEIYLAGFDMGGRIKVVKWLSDKRLILKVGNHDTLCGARGNGMVWPFPTEYYLAEILDEKIPENWNAWDGYIKFTNEMTCGRKWRKGIKMLEEFI